MWEPLLLLKLKTVLLLCTYALLPNCYFQLLKVSFSLGLTCQHVSQAVDVHHVKRAVAQSIWSICSECLKERRMSDGEPVAPSDIWLCLKCGSQVSSCSELRDG